MLSATRRVFARKRCRRLCTDDGMRDRLGALFERVLTLQEQWSELQPAVMDPVATHVAAAQSKVHGQGVFAQKDLPARTVATLYPVHAMGIGEGGACAEEDTEYFVSLDSPSAYRMQLLHHNLQKTYGLPHGTWVDANPHRSHAPGWQAHLANDGAICRGATEADVLAYYDESERTCNCVLVPFGEAAPLMALVTTRAVTQGEELLTMYGHSFWIEQLHHAPVSPDGDAGASAIREEFASVEARCQVHARVMADVELEVALRNEEACRELSAFLLSSP